MAENPDDWRAVSFHFIGDPRLREIVEDYYKEALMANDSGMHVAAVILCGSVLEGVLSYALRMREEDAKAAFHAWKGRSRRPSEWSLEEKVEVARTMRLIGEGPAKGANAVRDFRHLIHPERVLRRSKPRWPALAQLAIAAVVDVTSSLSGRMQS